MHMAFTEEQAVQIRKRTGLSIVQFKYCIKKQIDVLWYKMRKIVDDLKKALDSAFKVIKDFFDEVKLSIKDILDDYGHPTTRRFRFVKNLSKLGYDKRKMWVATRHTWLARSNC